RLLDRCIVELLAGKKTLGLFSFDGSHADVSQTNSSAFAGARFIECELNSDSRCGKVANLSLELQISAATSRRRCRNPDFGQYLLGLERGGEQAGEEIFDADLSLAFWTSSNDSGAEREHRGRVIVGRIAVREIATDRRLAAHERIRDHFRGIG